MDAGEKELRKAFEETTVRNVQASIDHSNNTRKTVLELKKEVEELKDFVAQYNKRFEEMTKQLSVLQTKVYAGGS